MQDADKEEHCKNKVLFEEYNMAYMALTYSENFGKHKKKPSFDIDGSKLTFTEELKCKIATVQRTHA